METLEDLNRSYVDKLLPNIIWMFVCLIIGTVGNTLVLLMYRLRMKTKIGNGRYFIPILAFWDLLSSMITSVHGLSDYFFYVDYPSNSLCKFLNFGSFFTSATSAHTLLLIAIQRYRKICVPHGRQMDFFWKRASIAVTLVFAFGYSLPVCFISGIWSKDLHTTNETTSSCTMDTGDFPLFYKIYISGVFLIVLSNIIAVTVLYSRIACFIYKHSSRRHSNTGGTCLPTAEVKKGYSKTQHTEQALEEDLEENNTSTDSAHISLQDKGVISVELNQVEKSTPNTFPDDKAEYHGPSKADGNEKEVPARTFQTDRQNSKAKKRLNKSKVSFNRLFGVIVIFYLLAYVPTLLLFVVISFQHNDLDLNVYVFLNRLYIVNHIVNPFVYGYFDICFRHSLKTVINCKQQQN